MISEGGGRREESSSEEGSSSEDRWMTKPGERHGSSADSMVSIDTKSVESGSGEWREIQDYS